MSPLVGRKARKKIPTNRATERLTDGRTKWHVESLGRATEKGRSYSVESGREGRKVRAVGPDLDSGSRAALRWKGSLLSLALVPR